MSTNLVPHERISDELLRYPKNRKSFEYVRPFQICEDACYIFNVARFQELREQLGPIVFVCCDLLIQTQSQGFHTSEISHNDEPLSPRISAGVVKNRGKFYVVPHPYLSVPTEDVLTIGVMMWLFGDICPS